MDGKLYNSFKFAKGVMNKKDIDLVILITGYPGTGKSTLATQLATFVDPTFTEERMCVEVEPFIEQIKKAKPRQAVVLDESYETLNSADIRKDVGRALLNLLNVVRQKNLYIFLIIPNFFDLGKQIAVFRSRWLIHCYEKDFGDIGRWACFDRYKKHSLYIKGKRDENYNAIPCNFFGKFGDHIPSQINYKKYLKNKRKGLLNISLKKEATTNFKIQRDKGIIQLHKHHKYDAKKLMEVFDISSSNIYRILQENIKEIKIQK